MSIRQFREIRLRDFRCFREQQAARLAPPGRIHATRDRKDFRPAHRKLLGMRNVCRASEH